MKSKNFRGRAFLPVSLMTDYGLILLLICMYHMHSAGITDCICVQVDRRCYALEYTEIPYMKVAVFFGSKSDMETMKKVSPVLKEFGIGYEAYILSAHRAGDMLKETVAKIEKDGCEVIIAGAGLSAALPGVIASETVLPVIGVPLECISGASNGLGGIDALLSIVQMPPKVPVATVGIGNTANAAYLAVEILAVKYPELRMKLADFRKKLADDAAVNGGTGVEL